MNAWELLESLRARGVALTANGESLHVEAPAGVLSSRDKDGLRAQKGELLRRLRGNTRCPLCLSLLPYGHERCPGGCKRRPVVSCRDHPAPGLWPGTAEEWRMGKRPAMKEGCEHDRE